MLNMTVRTILEKAAVDNGFSIDQGASGNWLVWRHCQSNWLGPTLLSPCSLGLGTKLLVRLELTKQGAARNSENSHH